MVDEKRLHAVDDLVDEALRSKGSVLFTITTASMEPSIRLGDQVEVRRLGPKGPCVGDIVLFRDPVLGLVVHRVLWRWRPFGRSRRVFTKGDAAPRRDRGLAASEVLGRVERIVRDGAPGGPRPRSRLQSLRSVAALVVRRLLRGPLEAGAIHRRAGA